MTQTLRFFLLLLCAACCANAQAASGPAPGGGDEPPENPVAQVRDQRSWEMGPIAYWGTGIGDRDQFRFFAAGFQLGKPLTQVLHAGILTGQFELAGNIQPFWQAYTPSPHNQTFVYQGVTYTAPIGGGTYTGVSLTPVIFRWNFATGRRWKHLVRSDRIQPWFQGAGGLIYTTHKFPPDVLVPHGLPGATSVWNFSPQGGIGIHWFTRPRRSVDLSINAVHISSASLGDHNPGVNASVQIQAGYTWWK